MRTIESPGVEISEKDLSFNTELPYGTTSLVVGYAKQGPTDELLNVTSIDELEQIYGLPENAAERYMYQTAKQILNANGNMLVTRLPYGSGDGAGYTTKYSALIYPYIPVDIVTPCETYDAALVGSSTDNVEIQVFSTSGYEFVADEFSLADLTSAICVSEQTQFSATMAFVCGANIVSTTFEFDVTGSTVVGSNNIILSAIPELSAANIYGIFNEVSLTNTEIYVGEKTPNWNYTATISANSPVASATLVADIVSQGALSGNYGVEADGASHYFLGQPIHVAIDADTYFSWLEGGINWKSTVTSDVTGLMKINDVPGVTDSTALSTILANVGYGAMVIVNEAKTTIDEQFAGYYVAIADNSKMDKGSNFDSIQNIKSFNQYSEFNEWVPLNQNSLAFTLTGTYYEHAGSVSEIVESVPDFDFSNTKAGGFGDSLVVALFKVRPTIYNQDERVLDKVLYEAHIGSFDYTRQIQSQAGGSPLNFYIEDVINKNSNNLKIFVNPYISRYSGAWYDPQTQEPQKFVRVAADERRIIGSPDQPDIGVSPAEPHGTAKVIFDQINSEKGSFLSNGDNIYGIGEAVPCEARLQKSIGNLPRKLEKALRLAENYELLRIDLVPEGGLGTVWTGMNLDMNNWPADATNRTNFTRVREIYDDSVYINGILNAHTFDADSDGLLNQENGSASEASDLYESVASIFNQFCQFTRKDCLQIADPLRHIFVQGSGEVKVMDNKKLNFSQHIFWPLKNLFGGLNTSYACTYANWFKINETTSDRFVWAPPSGYIANLMIKTDTNFFPWYAPAGLTRGVLSGIVDIGINPTQKQRDLLYKNGINPTVYWPGDGYVVWGQKTLQRKPSAFDRINVRRLFLWAEKAVLQIARYFVFEQNTPFTRSRLRSAIDPVLGFAKSNEGIYDYLIVCDDRNNPPEVIDRNELVVDIYIKPVRVAEYILINFIATRTGQNFEELI